MGDTNIIIIISTKTIAKSIIIRMRSISNLIVYESFFF
jgi:hypothetical protein